MLNLNYIYILVFLNNNSTSNQIYRRVVKKRQGFENLVEVSMYFYERRRTECFTKTLLGKLVAYSLDQSEGHSSWARQVGVCHNYKACANWMWTGNKIGKKVTHLKSSFKEFQIWYGWVWCNADIQENNWGYMCKTPIIVSHIWKEGFKKQKIVKMFSAENAQMNWRKSHWI